MFVAVLNSFLSYLLLAVIIVVLGGVAISLGITMRKKKNAQEEALKAAQAEEVSNE